MKLLIALYHPFTLWTAPPWLADKLRAEFSRVTITHLPGPKYAGLEREIADADACIAWSIRPEQFRGAQRLKWIHSPAAAVHQLMFPELVRSDVVVTNARDVHGPVVAEHAIALVCALAKKLHVTMQFQAQRIWGQQAIHEQAPPTMELEGSHAVVVGMGSIGREFARRAKALGVRVTGVREHPERGCAGADAVVGLARLNEVLKDAEFVVLAAPLTESTRHLINAERLRSMKPTTYLINVGRGPLIDDDALISALTEKRIAGAALDVFTEEPLPTASAYWGLPNVMVTPHTAAVTTKLWERHFTQISENLRRFLAGEPLAGIVDKKKGY